jgi:hypothetical protein
MVISTRMARLAWFRGTSVGDSLAVVLLADGGGVARWWWC